MIQTIPKTVYFGGCVARLESALPDNKSRYRVLNGEWMVSVDHDTNEAFDFQKDTTGKRVPIEYSGPFPDTCDYTTLILHAEKAMKDPSVNAPISAYLEGHPQENVKTYVTTDDYYIVSGYKGSHKLYYGSHGYDASEWGYVSNGLTPHRYEHLESAKHMINKYGGRGRESITGISITHVKRRTTKVIEEEISLIAVDDTSLHADAYDMTPF